MLSTIRKRDNRWGAAVTIELKPDQESRVAKALRSGAYSSPGDVIDRALEALQEQDEWLLAQRAEIHAQIHSGLEEVERGEGIPEDELDEYLARLKSQPE